MYKNCNGCIFVDSEHQWFCTNENRIKEWRNEGFNPWNRNRLKNKIPSILVVGRPNCKYKEVRNNEL